MKKIKKVNMEVELVFPYQLSMNILIEFCNLWDCNILKGGTRKIKAIISMPYSNFKKIFKEEPQKKEYKIPSGMEKFINNITVRKAK
jgi:hypothetical protein